MNRALLALVLVPALAACGGVTAPPWSFSGTGAYQMRIMPSLGGSELFDTNLVDANGVLTGSLDLGMGNTIPITGSHSMVQAFPVSTDLKADITSASSTCLNNVSSRTLLSGQFTSANMFKGTASNYSCQDAGGGNPGILVLRDTGAVEMTRK